MLKSLIGQVNFPFLRFHMALLNVSPTTATFLREYRGNFAFILSVRSFFMNRGGLTAGQIAGVEKCMAREASWAQNSTPAYAPVAFSPTYVDGTMVEVSRGLAQAKGKELGIAPFLRHLRIVSTVRETARALLVRVEFVAEVVSKCHVCGRTLTTDKSRACGIGPTCCAHLGIDRPDTLTAEELLHKMEEIARGFGVKEMWLPKRSVKALRL
jgi:hypothetical protein